MRNEILKTFYDLAALNSVSGQEEHVRDYLLSRLVEMGLEVEQDEFGNLIGFLEGVGEPILLNAHMDGVPPGLGHKPTLTGDILTSDGKTNLRADDIAGMSIILEATQNIIHTGVQHPPIVIAFTAQEENGLWGAKALDIKKYKVTRGIVFDNAFEAGVVVNEGACYVAFDVEIKGKEAHPGKDLENGINAFRILLNTSIVLGETDGGETRINVGKVTLGNARNVVPGNAMLLGEVRSFLKGDKLEQRIKLVKEAFTEAASVYGGTVDFKTNILAESYKINLDNPLLKKYREILKARGVKLTTRRTFVASDANALKSRGLDVFVISTGVVDEHTTSESVNVNDLVLLTEDLIKLLTN